MSAEPEQPLQAHPCLRFATPEKRSGSRVSILGRVRLELSLTGHPMPPRITQESCKAWLQARVSDRTMVGTPTDVSACWRFRRRGSSTQGIIMDPNQTVAAALSMRTCERLSWRKGLNAENLPSPTSPGKNILLTFPFIEPARRRTGQQVLSTPHPFRQPRWAASHRLLSSCTNRFCG